MSNHGLEKGGDLPRRRRAARLSLLAVTLFGLTLAFLLAAAWIAVRENPADIVGSSRSAPTTTSRPSR